jgi:hypothetical protein
MNDPKPNLSRAGIVCNVEHYHSLLNELDLKRDLLKEQLLYWIEQLALLESNK